MRSVLYILLFAFVVPALPHAQESVTERRDKALAEIGSCLARNEASSRQCKDLNKSLDTLVDAYRSGDKSVLPTLFQFKYLTDFYDEALIADPDGFLMAAARLSEKDQKSVATGIAGGMFGLHSKERFEALRERLKAVPDSSPSKALAVGREVTRSDPPVAIDKDQMSRFLSKLDRARFWDMPTEVPSSGFDGAEWIMEGSQNGGYHPVVRWCPDVSAKSPEEKAFAEAARFLFELAGHKHIGSC